MGLFKPKTVVCTQVISDDNTFAPDQCFVIGAGLTELSTLRRCNVTWMADMVYDLRTNTLRNLAAERGSATTTDATLTLARTAAEFATLHPMLKALRRS